MDGWITVISNGWMSRWMVTWMDGLGQTDEWMTRGPHGWMKMCGSALLLSPSWSFLGSLSEPDPVGFHQRILSSFLSLNSCCFHVLWQEDSATFFRADGATKNPISGFFSPSEADSLSDGVFAFPLMRLSDVPLLPPFVIVWKGLNCITCKWRDLIFAHYLFIRENEQNISGSPNREGCVRGWWGGGLQRWDSHDQEMEEAAFAPPGGLDVKNAGCSLSHPSVCLWGCRSGLLINLLWVKHSNYIHAHVTNQSDRGLQALLLCPTGEILSHRPSLTPSGPKMSILHLVRM